MKALEKLLLGCHQSSSGGHFHGGFLHVVRVVNPTVGEFEKDHTVESGAGESWKKNDMTDGMWKAVVFSIDYDRHMPELEEIEIVVNTVS